MADLRKVSVKAVAVPAARARTLHPQTVRVLAADMLTHGLRTPITLRAKGRRYALVDGLHRLEAARWLEWTEIDALVLAAEEGRSGDA